MFTRTALECTHHEGSDSVPQELINEIRVEFNAFRIDRIGPPAIGNDTSPSYGEPVGFDTVRLEQRDVFLPKFVGICRDIAVTTIQSLSWCATKVIPNGLAASVQVS